MVYFLLTTLSQPTLNKDHVALFFPRLQAAFSHMAVWQGHVSPRGRAREALDLLGQNQPWTLSQKMTGGMKSPQGAGTPARRSWVCSTDCRAATPRRGGLMVQHSPNRYPAGAGLGKGSNLSTHSCPVHLPPAGGHNEVKLKGKFTCAKCRVLGVDL